MTLSIKFAALLLFILAPAKINAEWGIELTDGYWKMDGRNAILSMKYIPPTPMFPLFREPVSFSAKITREVSNPGFALFCENEITRDWKWGASIGFDRTSGMQVEAVKSYSRATGLNPPALILDWSGKIENMTISIPLTLYAKWRTGKSPLRLFGGIGGDLLMAKTRYSSTWSSSDGFSSGDLTGSQTFGTNKLVPHLKAGGEYFFGERFSLGCSLQYLFDGRLMTGEFGYDYSGLRPNFSLRYYFGEGINGKQGFAGIHRSVHGSLAEQSISTAWSNPQKNNLVVADFAAKNVSQADASIVADLLRTELVGIGAFNIMERNNMDAVLAEQKFQSSGCTQQECALEMGKLLNVRQMVVGSLSRLHETYFITLNLIDVETGKIIASYYQEASSAGSLSQACKIIAQKLSQQ